MSARKQRLRLPRQGASLPLLEEEEGGRPDPRRVRAPEPDTSLEAVATTLSNPIRALIRRVFFAAEDKSKYVSVAYYPARDYQPLAENGGAKKLPPLLNVQQLQTMADNITAMCDALCTNEYYMKDGDFRMITTCSYRVARVYLGKQYMTFTYEDLRNLAYIMYMIQNQMTFYIAAMTGVIAYIDTAHSSTTYVEPPSTANTSINYYQMFEELKSVF